MKFLKEYNADTTIEEIRNAFIKGEVKREDVEETEKQLTKKEKSIYQVLLYLIVKNESIIKIVGEIRGNSTWVETGSDNGSLNSAAVRLIYGARGEPKETENKDRLNGTTELYPQDQKWSLQNYYDYLKNSDKIKWEQNKTPTSTMDRKKDFLSLFAKLLNIDYSESETETNQNGDSNMDKKPTTKEMIAEEIEAKGTKQLILTGAPGTGKTFSAKKYVEEYIKKQGDDYWNGIKPEKNYGFVQFHSSYSYTDFVEGLRPVMTDNEQVSFVRMDGVFKEFCRKVVKNGDENHNYFFIIDEINRADLSKVFGELMFGLEDDYRGKGNEFDTQYKNLPTYRFEKKDNGEKKAEPIENDVFAKGFYIPENVIIIGTMNDIDRSVEAFDFALRRRFRWINVKANDVMDNVLEGMNEKLGLSDAKLNELSERAKALNKAINEECESLGLKEDYHIGPAYYKHYRADTKNEDYFTFYLEPILMEYVRGRKPDKINNFIGNCKRAFIDTKTQDGSEADGKVNDNG